MPNALQNMNDKSAFHEAGHAVVSYFTGYACNRLEITKKSPTEMSVNYDFGVDFTIVSAISCYKSDPSVYDDLPESVKNKCRDVAFRTIIVLLAGSAAEAVYLNGGKVDRETFVRIASHDLAVADNFDYFLSIIKQGQHPSNYLQGIFRQVLQLMDIKVVWNSIIKLAETLISGGMSKVDRSEIENILETTGFFRYLQSIKVKKPQTNKNDTVNKEAIVNEESAVKEEQKDEAVEQPVSKKECERISPKGKNEAAIKIINFIGSGEHNEYFIGIAENPGQRMSKYHNLDVKLMENCIILETDSPKTAKEIERYFLCLGMTGTPENSDQKSSTVYVYKKASGTVP